METRYALVWHAIVSDEAVAALPELAEASAETNEAAMEKLQMWAASRQESCTERKSCACADGTSFFDELTPKMIQSGITANMVTLV